MLARNELQNAADAAALAGAQKLCGSPPGSAPTFTTAENAATTAIGDNKVLKASLASGTVTSGYWSLTGTPAGMQSRTKNPVLHTDAAAVSVKITKAPGSNGGSVALFLGPLVGISSRSLQASAVAVESFPSSVDTGQVLPIAIGKCLYDTYWDATTKSAGHQGRGLRHIAENIDVLCPAVNNWDQKTLDPIIGFGAFHIDDVVKQGNRSYVLVHFITNVKIPEVSIGGPYYGAYVPPVLGR